MRSAKCFRTFPFLVQLVALTGNWLGAQPVGAAEKGPELVLQTGHSQPVSSVAFGSDGKFVVTGSWDATALLWDAATGQQLRTFKGPAPSSMNSFGEIYSVALSGDGKRVLTNPSDRAILWDVSTGERMQTFKGHTEWVKSAALSADGKRVLTGSVDKTAILWDAASGQQLHTFEGHADAVNAVALSSDGKRALTGSSDFTAILWDAAAGRQLQRFTSTSWVLSVALSGDSKHVLTGSQDKTATLWDAASGQQLQTFKGHSAPVNSVALNGDGTRVLTGSDDQTAILWDAASGQQLRTFKGHTSKVLSVALSPDGKQALTGAFDKMAILWDASTGKRLRTFNGNLGWSRAAALSPDGQQILTGSSDGRAMLWNAAGGQNPQAFRGHTGWLTSMSFSGDGKRFLTSSDDKTAILWDAVSGQKLQTFKGHTERVWSAALSSDGQRILTGSGDKTAILWDAAGGQKLQTFSGHQYSIFAVALSGDGKRVLTTSLEATNLWDAGTGQILQTFKGHAKAVHVVALSRDGQRALTGSVDGTTILWDTASGRKLQTFKGHAHEVTAVAFSGDGKRILTGSVDETAILWDAASGQILHTLKGHTSKLMSVALSGDGTRALTASADGTARFWNVDTGKQLCSLVSLETGADWVVVTPDGLFDGSAAGRQKVMYRVGGDLSIVPVDRFFQDYYRPGLLASIVKGEKPEPTTAFAGSKPPTIKIISPKDGNVVEKRELSIETEVTDQGGGIQGPSLFLNCARLAADATTTRNGKTLKRSFKVSLVEGDNRFEVKAASGDGSWESEPTTITLRFEKPLDKPVVHVVAIGISRYAEGSFRLKYATDDARSMARLFDQRGRYLYREVKVTTLLDEDASRERIQTTLKVVPQQAQPQDTLVLFLAGHGVMVGQRYYFIPYDFRASKDRKLEDDIRQQGLPADELTDFIGAGTALKRIVILDTCASGGVVSLFKAGSRNPFAFRGEIEKLSRAQGICFLAASSATEEAKEPEALGHGVLTYTLLAGLKAVEGGPLEGKSLQPTGKAQVVEVVEWFSYANGHVARLTKEYCGQEQNVQMSVQGQSFPVLPLK